VTLILVTLFAILGLVFFDVILDFTELFFQFFGCRQFSLIFLGQSFSFVLTAYQSLFDELPDIPVQFNQFPVNRNSSLDLGRADAGLNVLQQHRVTCGQFISSSGYL
jgi:hypothetical protein